MRFRFSFVPRDQENLYTEKMQNLQQTLVEERDKILQNANQQRSVLEESLHSTKTEEQRLRTKLAEAEEVGLLAGLFVVFFPSRDFNSQLKFLLSSFVRKSYGLKRRYQNLRKNSSNRKTSERDWRKNWNPCQICQAG